MTKSEPALTIQTEPLWVGMRYAFDAISGRVIGWTTETTPALYCIVRDHHGRPVIIPNPSTRGRAVVLIHASSSPDALGLAPLVTIDANWPCRFVTNAAEAWQAAVTLQAEFEQEMVSKGMVIEKAAR